MLTRRDLLKRLPATALLPLAARARAAGPPAPEFERFDSHVHVHRDAPAVLSAFRSSRWKGLNIVVCPAVGDEPSDLEAKLLATLKNSRASRGSLPWASTFDARPFDTPGFADRVIARLRRTFDDGAIGVKIWKTIGMAIRGKGGSGAYLLADDPSLIPVYEAIEREGRTLIAHLAEPDGAWLPLDDKNPELEYYSKNPQWHMLGKAGAPSKADILAARDRLLARFPRLRVVGCHLGSDEDDLSRLAKRLDTYPNFAADTAARVRYFARGDREQVRQFLTTYQDRILYGTDFSVGTNDDAAYARNLQTTHDRDWEFFAGDAPMEYNGRPTRGLGLPEPVLKKIFRENALRWLPGIGG